MTITYTKLPYPDPPKKWTFSQQIPKYFLLIGSGNLQLEQTKFPVFWQNFQIRCVFPDRDFFCHFPCFPCAMGTLLLPLLTTQRGTFRTNRSQPERCYLALQGRICRKYIYFGCFSEYELNLIRVLKPIFHQNTILVSKTPPAPNVSPTHPTQASMDEGGI